MRHLLRRLAFEDRAQDLIEYALLSASLGLAGLASWPAISAAIGTAYTAIGGNSYNLWEPPAPGGGS